jgi:hypothetical protein
MKVKFILLLSLLLTLNSFSQDIKGLIGDENWFQNWTNFKPATTDYKDASIILAGIISENTTLYKKNIYRLTGTVYVTKNAVLTIEAGTLLRGDSESNGTLVITKGAKIIAVGTETDPIVFTSNKEATVRKAGDWGGIVILGDAPINKFGGVGILDMGLDQSIAAYGGNDEANDSGVLKYVRIEYAGKKVKNGKDFNGLTLAGVGNKTQFDFIQVSFSNDDSFECYGGNVKLNNLISFKATDDDYDFTQGVQCALNNSVAMRYPYISSDLSLSRSIEIDSYDKPENMDFSRLMTKVTATNVVLTNNEENLEGLVREAIYIRDKSSLFLDKSLINGFSTALLIAEPALNKTRNIDNINIKDCTVNFCTTFFNCEYYSNEISTDFQNSNNFINNIVSKVDNIDLFREFNIKKNPDFRLKGISNVAFSK